MAAQDMVAECMRQFPDIVNHGAAPEYSAARKTIR